MELFKMAWRNVWRNRRRTWVTVGAMSVALLVMILYSGLVEGYLQGMERSILELEVGDLQIHAADYRENPSLYTRIENPEALLAPLESAGYAVAPRVLAFGLAAAGESSAGVSFRGLDLERDARVSRIHEGIGAGSWLDASDPKGVVLGSRLARTLAVSPGDELVVLTQGADGAMAYDLYLVRGVLRAIANATDRTGVFMLEETLRELLVVPEGVHQIIVRRPSSEPLDSAAGRVAALAIGLDVRTWRQLMPTLSSLLESARGIMFAMYFIIYIAIGMLILNAMLMAVFERIREIGVLKALGAGPLDVMKMILVESGIQMGIAIGIGVGLSIPSILYLERYGLDMGMMAGTSVMGMSMDPIWRASVSGTTFFGPVVMLVVIVVLAVLYPACKAALIRPVEAMQYH